MESQLKDPKGWAKKISKEDKTSIEEAIKELEKWMSENKATADVEDLTEKLAEYEAVVNPITEKLHTGGGGGADNGDDDAEEEEEEEHDEVSHCMITTFDMTNLYPYSYNTLYLSIINRYLSILHIHESMFDPIFYVVCMQFMRILCETFSSAAIHP